MTKNIMKIVARTTQEIVPENEGMPFNKQWDRTINTIVKDVDLL